LVRAACVGGREILHPKILHLRRA